MDAWYYLSLGDGMTASGLSDEIEESFQRIFTDAGKPMDMAVFTRLESGEGPHCEVTAYFSPGALDVAKAFGAQPCPRPMRTGLDLLAGDTRS
jgi:hypothetical protein